MAKQVLSEGGPAFQSDGVTTMLMGIALPTWLNRTKGPLIKKGILVWVGEESGRVLISLAG